MVSLTDSQTIIGRQLQILDQLGISKAVITTGFMADKLTCYVNSLKLPMEIYFVNNAEYEKTNYIYSIFLARKLIKDDIILMHGDLVFEKRLLREMLNGNKSCMAVSTLSQIQEKDFKALIKDEKIVHIGTDIRTNVAAQPLYVLKWELWRLWLDKIEEFCRKNYLTCYAENALNQILDENLLYPFDFGNQLCQEVDEADDLLSVRKALGN